MSDVDSATNAPDRRSRELAILNDVARTLNASVDLPSLLERALAKVAALLRLDTGWVLLLDETTGEPYLAAALNLPLGLRNEPERMTGWCYCLETFQSGELDAAQNVGVLTCSRLRKLALAQGDTAGLRFHASVPLEVFSGDRDASNGGGRKRLGMLNVAALEWRQLGDDELDLLRTIGDVLGVAVERARLHTRSMEAAQTQERNRLAREIHDTIAQDLSAIVFQLDAAEALIAQGADAERLRRHVTAAIDLARKGLEEARRSVLDLRAGPLEGRTLVEALDALARHADAGRAVAVVFVARGPVTGLPPAVEVGLYRIAQEAVQNALRHAGAARVTLTLTASPDECRLTVEDDGRGFEPAEPRASPHGFGLTGMCERARLLGGIVTIDSARGRGTRITAAVPLDQRAAAGEP